MIIAWTLIKVYFIWVVVCPILVLIALLTAAAIFYGIGIVFDNLHNRSRRRLK